ncbi:hypothetical protein [Vibrio parahaemolyticus]|uniref:hypothetical protein n=1 Tax=Vibrio parahaemolyticus TaxID=670 RepID=UPI0003E21EBE|nr:hypothetical protein [Vibrio parahaemolyticus]EGQ7665404.1 hypothetical protein [Vibrio parahaemolyticus]EGR0034263.1 hypothetical protein [Vibrio parahaemolyticus]EGR0204710.1 hypothetical protein [Vibrio parahaemolyticus]EGR1879804.1 hypothetical protein [Vibrio parahaemolyticus]EGR2293491.1 hypothetical protein [Vibrio parahaemolyticus]
MFTVPDTEKKIRAKISSYKSGLNRELREYGAISDGYGKRYLIFPLLLVLNDLKKAEEYMEWYDSQFPDDIGEPIQMLCRSILSHRLGKTEKATYELAATMLSNVYLLPWLFGNNIGPFGIEQTSCFADPEHRDYLPVEVFHSISGEELYWIESCFESELFREAHTRFIEISLILNLVSEEERHALLNERNGLLKPFEKFS